MNPSYKVVQALYSADSATFKSVSSSFVGTKFDSFATSTVKLAERSTICLKIFSSYLSSAATSPPFWSGGLIIVSRFIAFLSLLAAGHHSNAKTFSLSEGPSPSY